MPIRYAACLCLALVAFQVRAEPGDASNAARQILQRAYRQLETGHGRQAELLFRQVLSKFRLTPDQRHRVWAQIGYIDAGQHRHEAAIEAFEAALAIRGKGALFDALGFSHLALGQEHEAIASFEKAVEADGPTPLRASQLGYLYKSRHQRRTARQHFVSALRLADIGLDPIKRDHLRREVRNLTRRPQFSAFAFHRAGTIARASPGLAPEAIGQSQFAVKGAFRLPDRNGRLPDIRLFGRAFWELSEGLALRPETGQAGLGVAFRPSRQFNLVIDIERFIKLGGQSRGDWLARARYSTGRGYEPPIGQDQWPYWSIYADAAVIGIGDGDLFGAFAGEGGYGFRLSRTLELVPHLLLAGLVQDDAFNTTTLLEAGAGLRLIYRFGQSDLAAPHRSLRLDVQWREPVAGDSRNANGLTLTLSALF